MKRTLVGLFLVVALMLGTVMPAFAASGEDGLGYGFNATGLPIVDEEITIKVLYDRTTQHGDFENYWFIDYVAEKTGIRLEFELVEAAAWKERLAVAFASDSYPDVFMHGLTLEQIAQYAADGYLVDLAPYIKEYAPETVTLYNEYPELVMEITESDGKVFFMPSINASPRDLVTQYPAVINKQWIDNLGLEMPTSLDELYQVLKAFKEQDADLDGDPNNEIPISSTYSAKANRLAVLVLTALGKVDKLHVVEDGEYVYVPATDAYLEYLKYMNKLYSEQLLDNEYFTMTAEALNAKLSTGNVGLMGESPYTFLPLKEDYTQYTSIALLSSDLNDTPMYPAQSACKLIWGTMAMTDKCEYPEAVVRLVDWFYTIEGSRAVRAGCEYGTWTDEEGVQYGYEIITPAEDTEDGHLIAKLHMGDYSGYWACRLAEIGPTNLPFNSCDAVNDIIIGGDEMNLWLYNEVMDSGVVEARKFGLPNVSFTYDENTQLSMYLDLTNYVETMEAKFITGEISFDEWGNYLAELERLGLEDMKAIYQAAYDRYANKPDQL
jgi:putative aldouronate transport system substrate-binding protein